MTFWLAFLFLLLTDNQILPPSNYTRGWTHSSGQYHRGLLFSGHQQAVQNTVQTCPETCTPWKRYVAHLPSLQAPTMETGFGFCQQYQEFPSGHPSKYYPGPMMLNIIIGLGQTLMHRDEVNTLMSSQLLNSLVQQTNLIRIDFSRTWSRFTTPRTGSAWTGTPSCPCSTKRPTATRSWCSMAPMTSLCLNRKVSLKFASQVNE